MDGSNCDSVKTAQYLGRIARLNSSAFMDGFNTNGKRVVYTLKMEGDKQPVTVQAYEADPANKYAIGSTANPDCYFSGTKENLLNTVFVDKGKFLPSLVVADSKQIKEKK